MAKEDDTEEEDNDKGKKDPKGKKGKKDASTQKDKGRRRKIEAVVVVIVVLALIYLYLTYGSLPTALLSGQLSAGDIQALIVNRLYSNNMVNLTYSGTATINNTDPSFNMDFLKYGNNTRTTISFIGFPGLANESVIAIAIDNGSMGYSCENQNPWNAASTVSGPYTCTAANDYGTRHIAGETLDKIVNISTISNLQPDSYGISLWNWQPCYLISGTGDVMVNGALVGQPGYYVESSFNFTTCMSAQYDVPLTLRGTVNMGNNNYMHFNINETSMGFSTNQDQVTSLPPSQT